MPIAVTITSNGIPVTPVESNAPSMIVAENGISVTITDNGAPFIIEGYVPPEPEPEDD